MRSFAAVLLVALAGLLAATPTIVSSVPTEMERASRKVRTQVTGFGRTESAAINDAQLAASRISFRYSTISQRTSGSGTNWTCSMTIEYEQR